MPNPNRAYTIAINQTVSSSSDLDVQTQDTAYAFKTLMLAAGWGTVRSSDGTTASAADNWASAAALEINTSGNGAWYVWSSPASWISAGTMYVIGYINTQRNFTIRMSGSTYTGGSVTALPTTAGTETAVASAPNIIGHTSAVAMRYGTWRTSRGDVMFAAKTVGSSAFQSFIAIFANVDSNGGGRGLNRAWVVQSSSTTDALTNAILGSGSNVKTLVSGAAAVGVCVATCTAWTGGATWTSGVDYAGETIDGIVDMYDTTSSGGRYLGQWLDVYGCPLNFPWGTLDDTESAQTYRRVCSGDVWLYAPTASLPWV